MRLRFRRVSDRCLIRTIRKSMEKSNIQKGWKAAERVELEAFSFEGRRSQSFRKALALGMCKLLPTESINNTETF